MGTNRPWRSRTRREQELYGPQKGNPWVWLTTELLNSPAWRSLGINARRLIDFLLIEHRNHAGLENGNLAATYDQLVNYGLTRESIRDAIEQADALGLLRFTRGGRWAGTNTPSRYRLTFLPTEGVPPTNDWKRITEADAHRILSERRSVRQAKKRRKNPNPGSETRTPVVRKPAPRKAKAATGNEIEGAEIRHFAPPADSAAFRTAYISRPTGVRSKGVAASQSHTCQQPSKSIERLAAAWFDRLRVGDLAGELQ